MSFTKNKVASYELLLPFQMKYLLRRKFIFLNVKDFVNDSDFLNYECVLKKQNAGPAYFRNSFL